MKSYFNFILHLHSEFYSHIIIFFIITLQHWIRLEIQPDILIHRLYMRVEPSDSSYMPSLVVVRGGESIHNLRELKTVNIGSTETLVMLLQDITEVSAANYPF